MRRKAFVRLAIFRKFHFPTWVAFLTEQCWSFSPYGTVARVMRLIYNPSNSKYDDIWCAAAAAAGSLANAPSIAKFGKRGGNCVDQSTGSIELFQFWGLRQFVVHICVSTCWWSEYRSCHPYWRGDILLCRGRFVQSSKSSRTVKWFTRSFIGKSSSSDEFAPSTNYWCPEGICEYPLLYVVPKWTQQKYAYPMIWWWMR